ncbi:16726_t:CDS:2 [Acaulospora colombiana]|uniref:16726_t:CDS:1 n=1 Tax=Acaulospora colombiana TaxID=27376 RepID=A0ACA9MQN8_9GLOM|nr:16726_t:CDS:2 [Acaulospora colombiana]
MSSEELANKCIQPNVFRINQDLLYPYDSFGNFETLRIGTYGCIFKATISKYKTLVVLKDIDVKSPGFTLEGFIDKLKKHQSLKFHDNILKVLGVTQKGTPFL